MQVSNEQASYVCRSCKIRKRKCNKALPTCSSCAKKNIPCEYIQPEPSGSSISASASDPWWLGSREHNQPGIHSIDFPTLAFLDPGFLRHGQVEFERAASPVPAHIMHLLGDMDEMHDTAARFFKHIHRWMPFISKKRFYELHLQPAFSTQPSVVLLLLSLKLITTILPARSGPRSALYHAVKYFYLEVEGSSGISILVPQAGILIALYELGHGIYPAAFLSIGACARYAHALGVGVNRTVYTTKVLTLVEAEERRRLWWAIVILDRFVSIGCPGRPFATADPQLDDLLPADDSAWDQGIVRPDEFFALSSPLAGHMSKFALLCQAARLLGQVLHDVSSESTTDDGVWMQLDRTLQSMLAAALNLDSPDHDQIAFVYSALVALHTTRLPSERAITQDTDRTRCARAVIQQITDRISANLVERQCFAGRDPEDMSPWGLFFAYRVCVSHTHCPQETASSQEVVRSIKEAFLAINTRWNVAGVYLQLLEAQEVVTRF
ncbi:putative fungal-specific transcription factor [Aspergillus steynii IBT 23096]|uniref:Putative fungal-specific transcription factor n=1 Tax=Aspergillus steynii IBT 23096 TaxID=1392250 RepID=A0A2I2FZJ8_9EURO|nr:putative fungal-specific transcription factor [Aspergillus steynii IBT 23096]PLB46055.1 putative fungal-specific transcription factor [Aspergillus steynii IBT 23096]